MVVYEIGKDIEHLVVRLFLYRSSLKYHHYLGDDLFCLKFITKVFLDMSNELKFKLWIEYPELREELFGDEEDEDNDIF